MYNKVLTLILGIGVAVTSFAADYVCTEALFESRTDEQRVYEELNADPHMSYNGYTVEQLGEGYEKPKAAWNKTLIEVPLINQYPELPVGCEAVCAASVLQYLGFDIDKVNFTQTYLTYDNTFFFDSEHVLHGPDPRKVFVGNPFERGYGCSSEVIAKSMNSYFNIMDADFTALSLEDKINSADIEKLIDEGVPIIVWATLDMKPFNYRKTTEWVTASGDTYQWHANSHTLVLCGYDSTCYYFMDCNDKEKITPYLKERFINRFADNNCQAVIVKNTSPED